VSIAYPGQGAIIALDPEIPPAQQRVVFKATPALPAGWHWQLNGKRVPADRPLSALPTGTTGSANRPRAADVRYSWFPMPGRHMLTLYDAKGSLRASASFEVRGAMLRGAAPKLDSKADRPS